MGRRIEDMILRTFQKLKGGNSRLILKRLNDERVNIFGARSAKNLKFHWIKDDVILVRCNNASIASELNFQRELVKERVKNLIKADFTNKPTFDVKFILGDVREDEIVNKPIKKPKDIKKLPPKDIVNRFEDERIRKTLTSREDIS